MNAEDAVLGLSESGNNASLGGGTTGEADEEEDLYALLGVEKGADADEITRGYRKMARKWHPDKNPGDVMAQAMTRKVNQAHDILSNPVKKRAYDKYGMEGLQLIDQMGEEGYVKIEKMEPYMPCVITCLCLIAIPTLCFCCCCCCCCCGKLKKAPPEDFDEPEDVDEENPDEQNEANYTKAPGGAPEA